MLNAVLHGKKYGLSQSDNEENVIATEDFLTASVFERLSYLSFDTFNEIITHICTSSGCKEVASLLGRFEDIEFWPSWYLNDGARVEPDCLLIFSKQDIIVEAKRGDGRRMQDFEQWAREISAYYMEKGREKKVSLLALGGLLENEIKDLDSLKKDFNKKYNIEFVLLAQSWTALGKYISEMLKGKDQNEQRLLRDIIKVMAWHGIILNDPVWFEDLPQKITDLNINFDKALTFFKMSTT